MVCGTAPVWVERGGRLERDRRCASRTRRDLRDAIERILAPLGRRVDEAEPLCDARLPDGSRVNVVIPPLALDGPVLTIRRFRRRGFTPDELVANGTLTRPLLDFLARAVRARASLLVCGGTGSGKTTTLNALSGFIGAGERVVTIEDAAELRLRQPHVVRLEARPPNLEGRGEVTIRRLVRNALRMRPDRIVVGEVRGAGGARHAHRAVDRPRRLAVHDPRGHAGRGAAAGRDAGADGRRSGSRTPRSASRSPTRSTSSSARPAPPTAARRVVEVAEVVRVAARPGGARDLRLARRPRRWRAALTDGSPPLAADRAARAPPPGVGARHEPRRAAAWRASAVGRGRRESPASRLRGRRRRGARRAGRRSRRSSARGSPPRSGGRRAARARRPRGPGADARPSGGGWRCSPRRALAAAGWLLGGPGLGVVAAVGGPAVALAARQGAPAPLRAPSVGAGAAGAARALADAVGGRALDPRRDRRRRRDGDRGPGRPRAASRRPRELALGDPTPDVLERLRRRAADPAWDAIVAGILLQRDAGGDLAGLLRDQAAALEAADRIEREARTATAQARFTARLVLVLPVGAAALAELASPGLIAGLLDASALGLARRDGRASCRPPRSSPSARLGRAR